MRIVAISGNMTACYGYRLFWPLNTLHLEDPDNYTCTITNLVDERMISGRQSNEGPADVLILSREVHGPNLVAAANMRRDYGTRIIYDVDDYLFDLPPWNPVAKWFANDNIRSNIEHFLTHCDAITVSTEPLRRAYAKYNEHIYVLPNSIWPRVPSRVRNNRLPVVGWSGAVGHDMDFARAREALEELGRTGEAFVKLFSCEDFPAGPTVYNTPYVPWKGYYQTLAALDFDIGLVPLAILFFAVRGMMVVNRTVPRYLKLGQYYSGIVRDQTRKYSAVAAEPVTRAHGQASRVQTILYNLRPRATNAQQKD